ncbi:MAG: hypothetical protein ABEI98_11325 [Halorhabdus sp.]
MAVIFTMEYHPVEAPPRRIRVVTSSDDDHIRHVTEERQDGEWAQIETEVLDYFEYADESDGSV